MIEMPMHPAITPPTMAPTFGPLLDDVVLVLVMPDLNFGTQEADAQEVHDATVWLQTSSDLHTGHDGGSVGQTTQRLRRGEPPRTECIGQRFARSQ